MYRPFRGKRIDTGEIVVGDICHHDGRVSYIGQHPADGSMQCFDLIPESVSQDTGVTDKKGKQVFDKSECVVTSKVGLTYSKGYIKFVNGCYCFVEYGTRRLLRLCDLGLNSLEIEVVNDYGILGGDAT